MKEQVQDYKNSTREYSILKYYNTCFARVIVEWAYEYYLLLELKQVLVCVFTILLQSSLLFSK